MNLPIRKPLRRPGHSNPGIARRDIAIELAAQTPGTPQYNYFHGIGFRYRLLRGFHGVSDYFRTRSRLWWFVVLVAFFLARFLWLNRDREDPVKLFGPVQGQTSLSLDQQMKIWRQR